MDSINKDKVSGLSPVDIEKLSGKIAEEITNHLRSNSYGQGYYYMEQEYYFQAIAKRVLKDGL